MTEQFSLDQKKTTILVALFLVLVFLVFIAGYLSGMLVGLPESEQPPVAPVPRVEPKPQPPVVSIPGPQVADDPEREEPEIVEVEEEPEPVAETPPEKLYSIQVGAFVTRARADDQKQTLAQKGYQPYIYRGANSKGALWYTVRVGDFDDVDEAVAAAREFVALESAAVVLTHFDSLMMVRDETGKRIEITAPEEGDRAEVVSDDPEAAVDDPEAAVEDPEAAIEEPEAAAEEPEAAAEEPETGIAEAEGDLAGASEALTEEPALLAEEAEDRDGESVGGLIATAETNRYAVQVGAFLNRDNAYRFAAKLKGQGYPAAYVFHYTDSKGNAWNAVRSGDFPDPETAKSAAIEFETKENITAIVTRIDAISMVYVK